MAAKGRIVNTTPKGKHSLERTRFTVIHSGGGYSRGRNDEKREARADEANFRAAAVAGNRGRRTPKKRIASRMIELLSDRRLRQKDGLRYD